MYSQSTHAGIAVGAVPHTDVITRSFRAALQPCTVWQGRRSFWVAGGVSALAWTWLAWRSEVGGPQLGAMLGTMAVTWTMLVWVLTRCSLPSSREVLVFAIGFRVIAFFATPVMEDDHHRFLWDGYRFAVTGNPYAEAPQARFSDDTIPQEFREVLDRVNHPDVPTIYGPLTQWAFRVGYLIAPARLWPWKLILLGAELLILALLWPQLNFRGRLLLAWCPLAVFETGFNTHPDVLAIALIIAAWWFVQKSRPVAAGLATGLAIGAKVFALPLLPFVLWRQGRRAWTMAAVAVAALYAPFWLQGSSADLAGLRAMAGDWEFNSSVFAIAAALAPREIAQASCAFAFGVVWLGFLARWAKTSAVQPANSFALPPGEWIYGAFLLLTATANPWYCLWLWPFVAAQPSCPGVCALAVVSLAYVTGLNLGDPTLGNFEHPSWLRPIEFGLVVCAGLWDWYKRETRS